MAYIKNRGTISRVLCCEDYGTNKKNAALAIYLRRRSRAVSIVLPSGSDGQPSLALATS